VLPPVAAKAFTAVRRECLDNSVSDVREVQTARFYPPAKMDRRVEVPANRQLRVAGRRHFSGEAFQIRSCIPENHVM